jgi:hypothetical protein
MMTPVPAVIVMTMSTMPTHSKGLGGSESRLWQDVELFDVPNSAPVRATVMRVVDCRRPSPMVR